MAHGVHPAVMPSWSNIAMALGGVKLATVDLQRLSQLRDKGQGISHATGS